MAHSDVSTFQYALWCISVNTVCTDCLVCSPFAQGRHMDRMSLLLEVEHERETFV